MIEKTVQSLTDLGFTRMEAQVYICLLADSPQSGYSVAKKLGKPAAYIYRAVDVLEKKGALLKQQGTTKLLRATPYTELIRQMEQKYLSRLKSAAQGLRTVQRDDWDDHIYTLSTADQVYERAREMLARSEGSVSVELYPEPFRRLQASMEEAAGRGVFVGAVVQEKVNAAISLCIQNSAATSVPYWPRQWLRIAVDGVEFMYALLTSDGNDLYDAVWSANPVQSWLAYYSMGMERRLHQVTGCDPEDTELKELRQLLQEWRDPGNVRIPPGIERFENHFGWQGEDTK